MWQAIKNIIRNHKEESFYSTLISKGDLCFDIGANNGKKSKLMLATGAKVIAFEPQSSCFEYLSELKKKSSNFEFHQLAVGAKNESKKLHLSKKHSEIATLSDDFITNYTTEDVFWSASEIVEVKSLDSLIADFGRPNYCKIDVEGYEFEILSNLHHTIPVIEFEFTEKFIVHTFRIIDGFDKKTVYNYILNEHLKFQLKDWIPATAIKEILGDLNAKNLHGNLFCKTLS